MRLAGQDKLRSRRALLVGAAGAAGAAALAGCGAAPLRQQISRGARVPAADVPILNALLEVEQYAVFVYAAASPLLDPVRFRAGRHFLAQEMAHVVELTDLVKRGRGKPAEPQSFYDLGHPHTAAQALALLERAERVQLRAYLEMIPRLSGGHIQAAVTTIFANDAQHLAVVRSLANQPPVPSAFAGG